MTTHSNTFRSEPLTVYAPASVGNMSVGFDALGLALAPIDGTLLGDKVTLAPLDDGADSDWLLECHGPFAHALPPDPQDNIVLACCRAYHEAAAGLGYAIRPLKVTLEKRLPIGSGLGSSASSIVAALEALNETFADLCLKGRFEQQACCETERDEPELQQLPRLSFVFNGRDHGRLRELTDFINDPEHWAR